MNSARVREFYWRFFRKRSASFLANLYSSSITGSEKDIHKTRLDMKRINAILEMFQMLEPLRFNPSNFEVFKAMFSFSGRIRELQVNQTVLASFDHQTAGAREFLKYLRNRENKLSKQFLQVVQQFDEKKLKQSEKAIKKLCRGLKVGKLRAKTDTFIARRAKKISLLRQYPSNPENVHGIRKHLKSMVTILTLTTLVFEDERHSETLRLLTQTEVLIGKWHDNQVLAEYIEKYLRGRKTIKPERQVQLQLLHNRILRDNQNLLQALFPKVEETLRVILPANLSNEEPQRDI